MITDADKQDETMELGRNRDRGNSQHSTRFARIRCYVATLRTVLPLANLDNNQTAGYSSFVNQTFFVQALIDWRL